MHADSTVQRQLDRRVGYQTGTSASPCHALPSPASRQPCARKPRGKRTSLNLVWRTLSPFKGVEGMSTQWRLGSSSSAYAVRAIIGQGNQDNAIPGIEPGFFTVLIVLPA